MIILDSITRLLQIALVAPVATNQLKFTASYVDCSTTTYTPGVVSGVTNNLVPVTLLPAPLAGFQRQLKSFSVINTDTATATVQIIFNDNTTTTATATVTLNVGDQLFYEDGAGWKVLDKNGANKASSSTSSSLAVFGASGTNHSTGLVPDPGATAGITRFLREDGTFAVPASTSSAVQSGMTMTQLTANQIYQRSTLTGGLYSKGVGTVKVTINLAIAATLIDYRLRDAVTSGNPVLQDWSSAAGATTSGAHTLSIATVPARAGYYYLDLRANGDNSQIVLGTSAIGMGDVTAISGQSLAVNCFAAFFGDTSTTIASLSLTPNANTMVFGSWGQNGATQGGYSNDPATWQMPGDTTPYTSSFAVEYLNRLYALTGVNQALVGFAIGATAISQWLPGQAYNTKLKAILSAAGGVFSSFIWIQGHADSIAGTSGSTWQAGLSSIVNDLATNYAGYAFKTIVSTIGALISTSQGTAAAVTVIRGAGKAWASANSGQYVDNLDGALYSGDGIHITQAGKIASAREFYRSVAKGLSLSTEGNNGPVIAAATRSSGSAIVRLTITENAGTALVSVGTLTSIFEVFNSGTVASPLTISTVTVVSATEVDITLSAAPANSQALDVYMRYPFDTTTAIASGIYDNATDSDGLTQGRMLIMNTSPITAAAPSGGGSTLPTLNETLVSSYDMSKTVYSDAARTTAQTTNAGTVQGVPDQSGNGNHLSQPTIGSAPVLAVGQQNSLNGLLFNNKSLVSIAGTWQAALQGSALTFLVIGNKVANPGSYGSLGGLNTAADTSDSSNSFNVTLESNGNLDSSRNTPSGNTSGISASDAVAAGTLFKGVFRFDLTNNLTYSDVNSLGKKQATTVSPYSGGSIPAWNQFVIGLLGPYNCNSYIYEWDIWSGLASDAEVATLLAYATSKWGS